jgi:hypothetical protein
VAFLSVSGESGCRPDELARLVARKFAGELITGPALSSLIAGELGSGTPIPDKAWPHLMTSVLARLGTQHNVVVSAPGSDLLLPKLSMVLRIHLVAPVARRIGDLMVDQRLDRAQAKIALKQMSDETSACRKKRFGVRTFQLHVFDLVLNTDSFAPEESLELVEAAARKRGWFEAGLLSAAAEAQIQFQARLQLAKYGLAPPDRVQFPKREFSHPSEEIFANLLDFYRVAWQYEPRSFPLQWDKDGKVLEAFTPDFYLPESDLYVELTTMKQALVTRKNRKVRLLRSIYPHINIQVFYQKDLQDLILKYGIAEKTAP